MQNGKEIIVHSFTFEEFDDNGEIKTKIIHDDGWYVIVEKERDPRILERYDPTDRLRMRTTTERDPITGRRTTTRELFDEDGNVTDVRHIEVRIHFLGDQIVLTKTFDTGHQVDVIITELDNGYRVTRNNFTYVVVFSDAGVAIYTEDGALLGTVVFLDDGEFEVIYPDGASDRVRL